MSKPSQPRVCLASMRGFKRLAGLSTLFEFEDVIGAVDDVDLISMQQGTAFRVREWFMRRLTWKPVIQNLVAGVNPGLKVTRLKGQYDIFVFLCMHPSDLIYLNSLPGWKECAGTKICIIGEFYATSVQDFRFHLSLLKGFDHVILWQEATVAPLQEVVSMPCRHLSSGVDHDRFSPQPNPPDRCIDIFNMGNRVESLHESFLKISRQRNWFYWYDTIPGLLMQPRNFQQHRDLMGNMVQRSRYFITFPAKLGVGEAGGQSETGARYYEGAATGAVLLGKAPTSHSFTVDFNWPDSVVDIGDSEEELMAVFEELERDPDRVQRIRHQNVTESLRRHDWSYRWNDILDLVGLEATQRMKDRKARLESWADQAEPKALAAG